MGLLAVTQVSRDALEVCLIGHKFSVSLMKMVELALTIALTVRVTVQGLKQR